MFKQNIKSCNAKLRRQRINAGERWKTTISLISKKATLHVQHTFFVHFFAVVLHDYRNFLVTRFLEKMWSYVFSFPFFHFPFCHRRYKIFMLFFQQKMPPLFFISRSRSLSPFFSLSFAGLPPTFSFSLCFSIFQICGHDN